MTETLCVTQTPVTTATTTLQGTMQDKAVATTYE